MTKVLVALKFFQEQCNSPVNLIRKLTASVDEKQLLQIYYKMAITAPINDVWYSIYESEDWPNWWKGVKRVKMLKENDTTGVNGIREYTWKSVLPYELRFLHRTKSGAIRR